MSELEFYRETRFKDTEIGRVPEDWEVVELGEVCKKITDGTHKTPKYVDKGIPFISTQNIVPFRPGFDFSQYKKYISLEEHRELIKRCKPEKGDILISKCGTIGRTKLIDVDYEFSIFVGLALLKLKKDRVSGEFLEQLLNFEPYIRRMEIASPGATRKTLTINAIKKFKISLPPLPPEQQKIAEILRSIDEAIGAVEDSITKLERLRKGAMEHLLTRGVNHTRFKEVELNGRRVKIPAEWEVVELGKKEYFEVVMGQSPPSSTYNQKGEGLPFLQGSAEFGRLYPTPLLYTTQPKKIANKNDILISVRAPVGGDVNIAPFKLCIGRGLAAIRPNLRKIDYMYLFYYLAFAKPIMEKLGGGSTFKGITKKALQNFEIPLPPLPEQQKIAEILRSIDEAIEAKRMKKAGLERMKKAVMEKLLTGGEVRVR